MLTTPKILASRALVSLDTHSLSLLLAYPPFRESRFLRRPVTVASYYYYYYFYSRYCFYLYALLFSLRWVSKVRTIFSPLYIQLFLSLVILPVILLIRNLLIQLVAGFYFYVYYS